MTDVFTTGWGWSVPAPHIPRAKPTMAGILADVCRRHGVLVDEVKGPSRLKMYTPARQEAAYLMDQAGLWTWGQIARAMGRGDHSTAFHHAKQYRLLLEGTHEKRMGAN